MARKKNVKKVEKKDSKKADVKKKESTVPKANYGIIAAVILAILVAIAAGYVAGSKIGTKTTETAEAGVKAYIIHDPNCPVCEESFTRAINALKELNFEQNIQVIDVDLSSDDGKKIYQTLVDNNVPIVPVLVFEGNIEKTEFYRKLDGILKQISRGQVGAEYMIRDVGQYKVLVPTQVLSWAYRVYVPGEPETVVHLYADEILRDMIEPALYMSAKNVVVKYEGSSPDYAIRIEGDPTIVQTLAKMLPGATIEGNAVYIPKTEDVNVDLYVMSFCPFGNQAEGMIEKVKEIFGDRVNIIPHYIISKTQNGYASLHGDQELHQDIREYCVYKYSGFEEWYRFVSAINKNCDSRNADSCWEGVATDLNMDINAIKDCYNNEFNAIADFLAADTASKGVTGSPTTFINGMFRTDIRDPNFPELVCAFMKNPPDGACSETIQTNASTGSCG